VRLTHVDTGTSALLIDRPGNPPSVFGCSGDHISASLDDEALLPVEAQCSVTPPALSGSVTPTNPLSIFDGESLAGPWRLTAPDAGLGDTGSLSDRALRFGVQRCDGLYATVVDTDGADSLAGTDGNDVIGGLGNDQLIGNSGDDRILGGGGGDTLEGNAGSDSLLGGSGNDSASGGIGIDSCEAEAEVGCEF